MGAQAQVARRLATLTALVAAYLILLVMVVGTVVCLIKFADILPTYAKEAESLTKNAQGDLTKLGVGTGSTSDALSKLDPAKLAEPLAGVIGGILDALGDLFLLVTLMFFFVVAVPGFVPRIAALRHTKPELAASMAKFLKGAQTYLLMTALFGAIVGVLDTGALWLLGVPLPLVWGFFSFITNFIPNIGFIIGIIPPAFLALLDSGWQGMLAVVLAYSVLNVTIQTFIQPRIVGNSVGLSAEITFLSLVVWTFLLGALGALLAVPMTLLLRAIFIDADSRTLLGGSADRRKGRGPAETCCECSSALSQPVTPTPMTKPPIRIISVALTPVECAAIHSFAARRRGSIRCGNRIVSTMGTTTVHVAIAV